MILKDARDYQIIFLSLFLVLGISTRDWTLRLDLIGVTIVTCLLTQVICLYFFRNQQSPLNAIAPTESDEPEKNNLSFLQIVLSCKSAGITALSLCLLLRADHVITVMLAAGLAIFSKFAFQVNHKHFFNPANFGIIAALILTGDAWVSPGQWGNSGWYALLFAGAGGLVLKKVGRWDTSAIFLATYAGLEALRNVWLGWTWDVFFHRLMSGSLLLFALFMITDPRSIPNARIGRILWAIAIACLTFIFRNQFFISSAMFWALFAIAPFTILFDRLWSAPRFQWLSFPFVPTEFAHWFPIRIWQREKSIAS